MRYTVLFYKLCLNFLLIESLSTEKSEVRRIIGGRDADEKSYPYIVRQRFQVVTSEVDTITVIKEMHSCTAAVLTSTWSLTAAHCFILEDLFMPSVKESLRAIISYGPHKATTESIVKDIIKHPAYKLRISDVFNDIALMRHEPIKLNHYAHLSGLDFITIIGQEVILTGYGVMNASMGDGNKTFVVDDATSLSRPLQMLDGLVVPCNEYFKSIKPSMCVARQCRKLTGICQGDSGGPLLHNSGVVAVNSVGNAFCKLLPFNKFLYAAGVTPISPFIDWISGVIKNEV